MTTMLPLMPRSHGAPWQFTAPYWPKGRTSVRVPHGVHHALSASRAGFRGGRTGACTGARVFCFQLAPYWTRHSQAHKLHARVRTMHPRAPYGTLRVHVGVFLNLSPKHHRAPTGHAYTRTGFIPYGIPADHRSVRLSKSSGTGTTRSFHLT